MEPTNKKVSLLRIVAATIYDSLLMLGVWFLVGSLALGIKFVFTGEVSSLNPIAGMSLVILSTWLYFALFWICLLYTSPSPRDATLSRMPSSA